VINIRPGHFPFASVPADMNIRTALSRSLGVDRRRPFRREIPNRSPFEDVDLALLRFVRCLIRFGLTLDEAGTIVSGELERFRTGAIKKQRRVLVGMRLVPIPV
jgi:hypothetical protein